MDKYYKSEELNKTVALNKKNNFKVCTEHFENKMFLNATTKTRLVCNAIPTKFNGKYYTSNFKCHLI